METNYRKLGIERRLSTTFLAEGPRDLEGGWTDVDFGGVISCAPCCVRSTLCTQNTVCSWNPVCTWNELCREEGGVGTGSSQSVNTGRHLLTPRSAVHSPCRQLKALVNTHARSLHLHEQPCKQPCKYLSRVKKKYLTHSNAKKSTYTTEKYIKGAFDCRISLFITAPVFSYFSIIIQLQNPLFIFIL